MDVSCKGRTHTHFSFQFEDVSCIKYTALFLSSSFSLSLPPLSLFPHHPYSLSLLSTPLAWKNGWQVISPKKSFAVFAATPTEKAEWMAHINKCIVDLLAKSKHYHIWHCHIYCEYICPLWMQVLSVMYS